MTTNLHSMDYEEYDKREGLNATSLEYFRISPAHYKAHKDGLLKKETPEMSLGTLIHRVALEPETIDGAFYVRPDGMKFTTKEGIAWRDSHNDKPIIAASDAETVKICVDKLYKDAEARELLTGGHKEQSCFVDDDGLTLKCRFDVIHLTGSILPDLKTTSRDVTEENMQRQILDFEYAHRAAFYMKVAQLAGIKKDWFAFIFCQTTPPYIVQVFRLDTLVLEWAARQVNAEIARYRECVEKDFWPKPSYTQRYPIIGMPEWKMRSIENEL